MQSQPSRRVLRKRCSENIQQIYRRTTMPKCDFNNDSNDCNDSGGRTYRYLYHSADDMKQDFDINSSGLKSS